MKLKLAGLQVQHWWVPLLVLLLGGFMINTTHTVDGCIAILYLCIRLNTSAVIYVSICARLVGGLGVGMASVLAPCIFLNFRLPIRGRLVALYQLSIVIGILLATFPTGYCLDFQKTCPLSVVRINAQNNGIRSMAGNVRFRNDSFGVVYSSFILIPESPVG